MFLVAALGTAATFAYLYFQQIYQPRREHEEALQRTMMRVTHLDRPVVNALDRSRYRDDDNDDVADPPIDAAAQVDPPTLYFSYIPDETAPSAAKVWQPFCDHLSKATGKPVQFLPVESVDDQLRGLRDGKIQVAGLNTGAVAVAVDLCGFVPVARQPGPAGNGFHQVEIIVPAGSPIRSVTDLRDHELALTAVASSSGYRAPLVLLKEKGLLATVDYATRYSGSHDASIVGVAQGSFEAAAVASDMLARAVAGGTIKAGQVRSIYTSPSFPNAGLGYAHNLKPALAAKLKAAILSFDAAGTELSSYFPAGATGPMHFLPVNYKEDWALVRSTDNAIGFKYEIAAPATQESLPAQKSATTQQ
jgi:phosphonate transport system substrate-binding protein